MKETKININNQNNTSFFTKKKIFSYLGALVFLVVLIVLLYKFFFNIEINQITSSISTSYHENKLFFLWFFLLLMFPVYNCILRILPYMYKLKKRDIRVEWYNWIIFCFLTFFIGAITPFAMGSEPYIIYWLNKKGLSAKEATAIVASFTVINPFVQVLITWPSFFVVAATYSVNAEHAAWVGSFWAVFVGLIFDLLGTIFWFLMSISKKIHFFIGIITNKIRKIFKMSYKDKNAIRQEYIDNAAFKKLFLAELKDIKFVIILSLGSLIWNVFYYSSIIFAFNLIDPTFRFSAWDLFNYVNIATTANNFIPIPGAEGTTQATIAIFIQFSNNNIISNPNDLKDITNNSVFIWRAFTFYLTTILGLIAFLTLIVQEGYKFYIRKKKHNLNIQDKSFSIILFSSSSCVNLIKTIKSILNTQYKLCLIQIIVIDDIDKNLLNNKLKKIIKENQIFYFNKNHMSMSSAITTLDKNKMIMNDYVTIVESNSFLNFEILDHINDTLSTYDAYIGQYHEIINNSNKISRKKIPYQYLYKKRISNKQQMCSANFELFNCFFKKELIKKHYVKYSDINLERLDLIRSIIAGSNKLRYLRRMFGNFYKNNYYWKNDNFTKKIKNGNTKVINNCIKDNIQELVLYKMNKYELLKNLENQKLLIDRKFSFKNIPFYLRVFYILNYELKYKKYFQEKKLNKI